MEQKSSFRAFGIPFHFEIAFIVATALGVKGIFIFYIMFGYLNVITLCLYVICI